MEAMDFSVEELVSLAEQLPSADSLDVFTESVDLPPGSEATLNKVDTKAQVNANAGKKKEKSGKAGSRTTNVDRCRRYREKRRKEEAQVYTENFDLKRERTELQRQIAQLELEVQALRGQGVVDLTKENELLRREIEKHKRYIDRVVSATRETPLQVEEEEEQRLLKSGIESAVGHIVGMMYSSMTDSSWDEGQKFELLEGMTCRFRFQLLPTGCDFSNAQRINTRIDCDGIACSPQDLIEHGAAMARDIGKWEATFKAQDSELLKDIHVEEVHPAVHYDDNEFISCSRMYSKSARPEEELIFVHAAKAVEIYQTAFQQPENTFGDVNQPLSSEKCWLLVSTTTDIAVKDRPQSDQVRRSNNGFHSEGMVVCQQEADTSGFSLLTTQPMNGPSIAKVFIDETGEVKQEFISLLRDSIALLLHSKR